MGIRDLLENPSDEQQETHDCQGDADDGTDDGQADQNADEHQDDAKDHRQQPARHFDDGCQQFPDRHKGP